MSIRTRKSRRAERRAASTLLGLPRKLSVRVEQSHRGWRRTAPVPEDDEPPVGSTATLVGGRLRPRRRLGPPDADCIARLDLCRPLAGWTSLADGRSPSRNSTPTSVGALY